MVNWEIKKKVNIKTKENGTRSLIGEIEIIRNLERERKREIVQISYIELRASLMISEYSIKFSFIILISSLIYNILLCICT